MIDIFHLDYYVQVGNYEAPIQKTLKEITNPTTLTQQVIKLITLDRIEVKTDSGILVDDTNSLYAYQRDSLIEYSVYNKNPTLFTLLQIVLTGKEQQYNRSYVKIQNILADTFSLINILNLFMSYINSFSARYQITYDIYKELKKSAEFEDNDENHNEEKKERENKNTETLKTEININKNFKKVLPEILPELNFFQKILVSLTCFNSYRNIHNEYEKMREILENSLDCRNLIKLYLTFNHVPNDYLPIKKTDVETSKSVRTNLISFNANRRMNSKSTK